jgi:hypothetical protein
LVVEDGAAEATNIDTVPDNSAEYFSALVFTQKAEGFLVK